MVIITHKSVVVKKFFFFFTKTPHAFYLFYVCSARQVNNCVTATKDEFFWGAIPQTPYGGSKPPPYGIKSRFFVQTYYFDL